MLKLLLYLPVIEVISDVHDYDEDKSGNGSTQGLTELFEHPIETSSTEVKKGLEPEPALSFTSFSFTAEAEHGLDQGTNFSDISQIIGSLQHENGTATDSPASSPCIEMLYGDTATSHFTESMKASPKENATLLHAEESSLGLIDKSSSAEVDSKCIEEQTSGYGKPTHVGVVAGKQSDNYTVDFHCRRPLFLLFVTHLVGKSNYQINFSQFLHVNTSKKI